MANTTNSSSLEDKATVSSLDEESKVTKVLVAGSGAVGKTTLVRVLRDDTTLDGGSIPQEYHRTPFIELETVRLESIGGTDSKGISLSLGVS